MSNGKVADPWQFELRESFNDLGALLKYLNLNEQQVNINTAPAFPLRVTRHFAGLMQKAEPLDPLLLQVLPQQDEQQSLSSITDAVGDLEASPVPGLIHKYKSRALLIMTGACAIHCRYCFRQHYDYSSGTINAERSRSIAQYLAEQTDVNELILSGGDPLSLSDSKLRATLRPILKASPQITTLRIHSRQPVVLPSRLGSGFKALLEDLGLKIVIVLHSNHPQEISVALSNAIASMPDDMIWLNQSVLLKGINDNVKTLSELSQALFKAGVLPYYLNQLDKVKAVEHFAVADTAATALVSALRAELPGYLVPKLVREVAGETSKTPLY